MKKTVFILFIFFTQLSFSQNLRRANNLFEQKAYLDAAELLLKEENKTQEIYEKLGDCYYFNTKMAAAANWYEILLQKFEETVSPNYYFRFSQALKGLNKFEEGDKWLFKYNQTKQLSPDKKLETLPFLESLNSQIKRPYIVHEVIGANSKNSDFGAAYFNNKIVFASTKNIGNTYDWNKQPYLDLYEAEITENGNFTNVTSFSNNINTKTHESNAVFTKDGKTMYFTRNNFIDGKKIKDKNKVTHLNIYKAQLIDSNWTNITELPFNSTNYSVEHPALSSDEKQLYFSSDMPGSLGSFDLFVVEINSDGTFGTPKNLGSKINTAHREQFPFISSNNTLYFASDGHYGIGGLDIFKCKYENELFSEPLNLSNPINSNLDDFAFIIDESKETGYFSSNRKGGIGDDDIYRFTQLKKYFVEGLVKNKNSKELLSGALVTLFDDNNNIIDTLIVNEDAYYSFEIENNKNYKIRGSLKLFNPYEVEFSTDNNGNINKNIFLILESYEDAENKIVEENGKIQIKINPIYFDFDKWNIRKDAVLELDNIVNILQKYPEMVIEIGAHTDCRGTENYNLTLSQKRANSVREYLVSERIPDKNVKSNGYGETQPLNNCIKDGICKEEEYDINRRCEFVILK